MVLSNGRCRAALRGGALWVGGESEVTPVDLASGQLGEPVEVPGPGLVAQVHEHGDRLVAMNVYGEVALVDP